MKQDQQGRGVAYQWWNCLSDRANKSQCGNNLHLPIKLENV